MYKYRKALSRGRLCFRWSCEARREKRRWIEREWEKENEEEEEEEEEGNHSLSTCGFLFHRRPPLVKIPALSISTQLRINELPRISCGLLCFAIILWLDNRADPVAPLQESRHCIYRTLG